MTVLNYNKKKSTFQTYFYSPAANIQEAFYP